MAKVKTMNTYDDVEKALVELAQHESFVAKKEAEMNKRIQEVKDKFNEQTSDERAKIASIRQEIESFCLVNKADFLKERSRKLSHGQVGFRTNPPKVMQLNKKFSVVTSIELIKKIFSKRNYLRAKEEINKDVILLDYSKGEIDDNKLAAVGLRIDQDETFFCEVEWEALEQKVVNIKSA